MYLGDWLATVLERGTEFVSYMAIEKQRHIANVGILSHKIPVKTMIGIIHNKNAAETISPTALIIGWMMILWKAIEVAVVDQAESSMN